MPVVKMNISFDAQVADTLRQRAEEMKLPASRYIANLVLADARRTQDALAAEGYRLLSADIRSFAEAAIGVAGEVWPEWEEDTDKPATAKTGVQREFS